MVSSTGAGLYTVIVATLAGLVQAAGDPAADIGVALVDVAEYPEVSIVVSAPPSAEPADVADAFEVLEDGEPRPLDTATVPAGEVEVVLVVDTAAVSGETLRELKGAATELLLRLPSESAVSLVATSDPPNHADVGDTSLHGRLAAVGALAHAGRRALHDAVLLALDQFSQRDGVPRSIVLIGGGVDVASATPREAVIDELTRRGVTVHALHWETEGADRRTLESLAEATGGLVEPVVPTQDAVHELDQILARLSNLYSLTFELRQPVPTEVEVRLAYGDRTARTTIALRQPADEDPGRSGVPGAPTPTVGTTPLGEDQVPENDTGGIHHAAPQLDASPRGPGGVPWLAAVTAVGVALALVAASSLTLFFAHRARGGALAAAHEGAAWWTRARPRPGAVVGVVTASLRRGVGDVGDAVKGAVAGAVSAVDGAVRTAGRVRHRTMTAAGSGLVAGGRATAELGRALRWLGTVAHRGLRAARTAVLGRLTAARAIALGRLTAARTIALARLGPARTVALGRLTAAGQAPVRAAVAPPASSTLGRGQPPPPEGTARPSAHLDVAPSPTPEPPDDRAPPDRLWLPWRPRPAVNVAADRPGGAPRPVARWDVIRLVGRAVHEVPPVVAGVPLRLRGIARTGRDAVLRYVRSRGWGAGAVRAAPDWREIAGQVHAELGGEFLALLQVADRIAYGRRLLAREARMADRETRYAAWALGALPLGVVAVGAVVDPDYARRLAGSALSLQVGAAALLALAGAWWLHRLSVRPFSLRPSMGLWYQPEHALVRRLGYVLERGALCAAAGLDVTDALRQAVRADPDGPGARLVPLLSDDRWDELPVSERESPVGRCTRALALWLEDGRAADEALVWSAAHLYLEQEWAWRRVGWPLVAPAVPVLACIVPAVLLLALV